MMPFKGTHYVRIRANYILIIGHVEQSYQVILRRYTRLFMCLFTGSQTRIRV